MAIVMTEKLEEVERLARALMNQWGLGDWGFAFSSAKIKVGMCRHKRGKFGGRIQISAYFAEHNPDWMVRDTVLHEIAHALTPGHGHDEVWKEACLIVGARPDKEVAAMMPPMRYAAKCPGCRRRYVSRRKSPPDKKCSWCRSRMAWVEAAPSWEGLCPKCGFTLHEYFPPESDRCEACGEAGVIEWRSLIRRGTSA